MTNAASGSDLHIAEVCSKHGDPAPFGEREVVVVADLSKLPYGTKLFAHQPTGPTVTAQQISDARRMLETIRPFTSRPVGGEGSRARLDQESRKAAFDELDQFFELLSRGAIVNG